MVSILAEEDIVKIGIWLNKERYFNHNFKLRAMWLFWVIFTLAIQAYFAIEIFLFINQKNFEAGIPFT